MNRPIAALSLAAFAVLVSFTATANDQDKPPTPRNFLAVLKEGQGVTLKEVAGRYEITVMDDVQLGQRVKEIGTDFVVIEAGISETAIHVLSIKCIVKVKVPKK